MAYDPFEDPDLKKVPKVKKTDKKDSSEELDPITHALAVMGQRALHALPETVGFLGDIANDFPKIAQDIIAPGSRTDISLPGTGSVAQAVDKSYDNAEEDYTQGSPPKARNPVERYAGSASDMIAQGFLLGGPKGAGAAAAAGAGAGVGSEAAHDLFPDSKYAPLIGMFAGGLSPVALSRNGRNALIRFLEGGGTVDRPKVSPKGAMGPMQVMPDTARDPGFGIKPWDGKSQKDLQRVGEQYADALHQHYGGDESKMLAAYNAGPGRIDDLIERFGDQWKEHLPKETIDYLARAGKLHEGGNGSTGGPVSPMDPEDIARAMGEKRDAELSDLAEAVPEPENFDVTLEKANRGEDLNWKEHALLNDAGVVRDPRSGTWMPRDKAYDLGFEDWREKNFTDLPPVDESHPNLTPTERQEMDASVPDYGTPPEAVDARTVGQGANYPEQVPANDAGGGISQEALDAFNKTNPDHPDYDSNHPFAQQPFDPDKEYPQSGGRDEPPVEPPSGSGDGEGPMRPTRTDEELTDKLANTIKTAKPLRSQQEHLYTAERSKRLKAMQDAAKMTSGEQRARARLSALGGELPKVNYEGIRGQFSKEEVDRLHDIIEENPRLTDFEKVHAETGLKKLLDGNVPAHGELSHLAAAFPDNVIKSVLDHRPFDEKAKDAILNALSLPRALRASADLSAPLRQGLNLIGRKEYWKAFVTMFKSMGKEGFDNLQNEIASRSTYPLMKRSGLSLTNISHMLGEREEMFLSKWAENLPHVKVSERAYIAFLNKLRADTFDSMVKDAYRAGIDFRENPKALKDIGKYINNATGRGSLGELGSSYKLLNAVFFSPRLMASRFHMLNPVTYVKMSPVVRRRAISDWIRLGGVAATVVTLAKMGGAEVETDPRSSDFGKIKIGNTRFDPYGGYQQYVHLGVVLSRGESKSPVSGNVTSLTSGDFGHRTRFDAALTFFRNKESPAASVIDDLLSLPKDRFGNKITPSKELINLFVPMVEEDIRQAYADNKTAGTLAIPAATFGVGVQTFQPKESTGKGKSAKLDAGYDPFSDPDLKPYDPFNDPALKGVQ